VVDISILAKSNMGRREYVYFRKITFKPPSNRLTRSAPHSIHNFEYIKMKNSVSSKQKRAPRYGCISEFLDNVSKICQVNVLVEFCCGLLTILDKNSFCCVVLQIQVCT
jgi:hypothetical protein